MWGCGVYRRSLATAVLGFCLATTSMPGAAAQEKSDESLTERCAEAGPIKMKPYKGVFFDNDFSYLQNPCLEFSDTRDPLSRFTDRAKRLELWPGVMLDLGGEYRIRYHNEQDHGLTRLAGLDNTFFLSRLRLYANLELGSYLRLYAEGIDAAITGNQLPARGIEEDRSDILNLFFDLRHTVAGHALTFRAGRQELLFGGQRLISPLNWGNTRRTFDGFRLIDQFGDFNVSAFAVKPRIVFPTASNRADESVEFMGIYGTFRGWAKNVVELYGLRLDESNGAAANFEFYTVGARVKGRHANFLYEVEGAYQGGEFGALDQSAGMFTAGVGYDLSGMLPWKPAVWAYYDWASGDGNPTDGDRGTFAQHFPLAHAYLGYMDLVGRQNTQSVSLRATVKPIDRLTVQLTGHIFRLDEARDALYNAGGGAIRRDATGASGRDVGREIDLLARVAILPKLELAAGYSHFFAGDFVKATNPPGVDGDADFFYAALTLKF